MLPDQPVPARNKLVARTKGMGPYPARKARAKETPLATVWEPTFHEMSLKKYKPVWNSCLDAFLESRHPRGVGALTQKELACSIRERGYLGSYQQEPGQLRFFIQGSCYCPCLDSVC